MIADLIESQRLLHEVVDGLSDEAASRKPDSLSWSVRDCLEHLALSELGQFRRLRQATPAQPAEDSPGRRQRIIAGLGNRSRGIAAPEHVQPTGHFGTLAQTLERFDAARAETIRYAQEHEGELPARRAQHPLFGEVAGDELILIMAMHVRRHTAQIRDILA